MLDRRIPHAHPLHLLVCHLELWHWSLVFSETILLCLSIDLVLYVQYSTNFTLFLLTQETEGWILSLLTSEQQFYIQISYFSLGTRAWNLMHCKSNPLLPFPPGSLGLYFILWYIFAIPFHFKRNPLYFPFTKVLSNICCYTHTVHTYTYNCKDSYCPLRKWLCTAKLLPFLIYSKLIKPYYTANHD